MYESLKCTDCGGPHQFDCVIPSEVWNKVAGDADLLCFACIDKRVKAAGLFCECEFYVVGEAVQSRLYADEQDA
jgi:hypothetical protein